ncbi:MAG TPA: hypothetical protein VK666_08005 [Chryseolinea sp.]|nr:hypothetical protein [Chryseolinea sp.]
MKCSVSFFFAIVSYYAHGQALHLYKIQAHTDPFKTTWADSVYKFPTFQEGKITFMTGFSPEQDLKLNYNLYFGQMDFINSKGDTLQIKPAPTIKLVNIGKHWFLYDPKKGYIELLVQSQVALGVLTVMRTERMDYVSGTIPPGQSADIRSLPSVYDRYYSVRETYYLIDNKNRLFKAMQSTLVKLFPVKRAAIKAYISTHHTDFTKRADLIELLAFCHQ